MDPGRSSRLGLPVATPATPPAHELHASTTRDRLLLLSICVVALLLRLVVVWECAGAGLFSDMQEYYDRARHLIDHGQFYPDAFRPPAYPVFLAALALVFDDHLLIAVRVVQAVLGAASVALTGLLAQRMTGPRAGLIAAAIVAVYPAWLIYPVYIIAETVFTFLTLLGLWLWSRRGYWTAMLAGLVLSIAMQTRAVGIATIAGIAVASVVALVIPFVVRIRRGSSQTSLDETACTPLAMRLALLVVTFAIALAPWVVRNARLFDAFIPTDTASGWNFLLGNNPLATGRLELDQIPIVSQTYWSRATTDVLRSQIGMQAGMAFIRSNPRQAFMLALRKVGYLLGLEGREHAWTYSFHFHGRRSLAVVWAWGLAILISFPVLMIAALAGIFRPGSTRTSLGVTLIAVLVFAVLVHVGSFGESRFHLPWVPVLAVMASTLWAHRTPAPWSWPRRALFGASVFALVVLWASQAPDLLHRLALLAQSTGPIGLQY